jgi:hypothetical protein
MSDIEQKTQTLSLQGRLRMAAACPDANAALFAEAADAIEQHEAFRQEVSDTVHAFVYESGTTDAWEKLNSFIIPKPKPDPLVEAMKKAGWADAVIASCSPSFRAALEACGLEIRSKNDG